MGPNYIALAIPFFFLLMGAELWVARRRERRVYRLADALTDMRCGIAQQVGTLFTRVALFALYIHAYENYRLLHFGEGSWVPWVLAFVGVDFLYYWWHRLSHEVNVMWAVHVVHHQSEDYNLAVALRQTVFSGLTIWPFYLTLALLGVPPVALAASAAVSTLYQFWIHTELVGKLGWLELFLNTPSHHRVHHAVNERYLDKNYGAVLIVWDRLFGTFEEEGEPAVYGTTRPLRSFNPLWAQVEEFVRLAREARRTSRWSDKLRVWFASPAWHPPGVEVEPSPVLEAGYQKYDVEVPARLRGLVGAHFALEVVATFALVMWGLRLPLGVLVAAALVLMLSLVGGSWLLERGRGREVSRTLDVEALPVGAGREE